MNVPVTLRESTQQDEPLLLALYMERRAQELAMLHLPEDQLRRLIEMQYRARCAGYRVSFPGARQYVLCDANGEAVGQLLVEEQKDAMRIVDLSVAIRHRDRGIGRAALELMQRHAKHPAAEIRLQVAVTSPARRLYERAGFLVSGTDGVFEQRMWRQVTSFESCQETIERTPPCTDGLTPAPGLRQAW